MSYYVLEEVLETHPDNLLYTGEAALALGVSVTTVKRWERAGRLPCDRNSLGRRYFRAGDVFALRGELLEKSSDPT